MAGFVLFALVAVSARPQEPKVDEVKKELAKFDEARESADRSPVARQKPEKPQLRFLEVQLPQYVFTGVDTPVTVRWSAKHLVGKGPVDITLKVDGRVVAQRKLDLRNGEDLRDTFTFRAVNPDKRVRADLVVSIKAGAQDPPGVGDSMAQQIRVIDGKIKVLFVEGAPRWQFKYLQNMLLRDPRIDARFLLVNADPKGAKGGLPYLAEFPKSREDLAREKYNVILLGDVPATFFSKDQQAGLLDFVETGGGLVLMAGRQYMPGGYEKTPLASLVPVEFEKKVFKPDDPREDPYAPTLTEAGRRASWLALGETDEDSLKPWPELPNFHWHYPATQGERIKPSPPCWLRPRLP